MPISRIAIGRVGETAQPEALKAALAEFIATLIFVFAGQGSGMACDKFKGGGSTPATDIIIAALAYGTGLFVAVSVAANISGGHVNPAVTFGAFIGGNITFFRGVLYWVAQLLGSTVACLLLKFVTGGVSTAVFALSGVSVWNGLVFEMVMTFALVYTVYATAIDPKKGAVGNIAPLAIGLVLAANILAGGVFTGAALNPAVAFGPALVCWDWACHWVYWVGPLVGAAIAAIIYDLFFINQTHQQLPSTGDF